MAYPFSTLQSEVKRRATRDQGGTTFDTAIKNAINLALFRTAREAPWRQLRRKAYFTTVTSYDTGSGAVTATNGSTAVTVTGATFLTDGVIIGRRINISGSNLNYIIRQITGETTLVLDRAYDGSDTTTGTYEILPQEEYNIPIQATQRLFLWHEEFGYPYQLQYATDQEFYRSGVDNTDKDTPTHYRMWGSNMVIEQLKEASAISVSSSSASDTTQTVGIFGTVSGYPDYESILLTGTTPAVGSKSFSDVERVVKSASTIGRITATANSGNTTVSVLPTGDTTYGVLYSKVQLYPLPDTAFDINVQYYKEPYRLVNDSDLHELGQEFDEAIILLATSKIKIEENQREGDKFFQLWSDEIRNLRKHNVDKMDWFPSLRTSSGKTTTRGNPVLSYSQVGSHYGPRVF